MGQRLNIEIVRNDKTIANCYYHWSAYTTSALATALMVLADYEKLSKENLPDEVFAVKLFENCSSFSFFNGDTNYAGLSESSYEYMTSKYPDYEFNKAVDRNAGLIGVTEEDMENTRNWEEGTLYIYIDKKMIDNSGLVWNEDEEDFFEMMDDDERESFDIEKLPVLPYNNMAEIPFDKIEEVLKFITDSKVYNFKTNDGSIISLIE
jgi:hypothetical protein